MKTKGMTNATNVNNGLNYVLTNHAAERIRQRIGIDSEEIATAWVVEHITKASKVIVEGNKKYHETGSYEIITDGPRVVTVKPRTIVPSYVDKLGALLTKEVAKLMTHKERELRKAEITVAEHTLNRLKARNPNTRELIQTRLSDAINVRQRIKDDIYAMTKAAEQYGVDV